jgi:acyl-CoA reductase-like NAD-dependent aldehyde dehydrogenase
MIFADQVVAELRRRSEEIAHTLTLESGKPIKDSKGEVARSIDTFQAAAEESVRIYGEHMPLDISARNKGLQVLNSQILAMSCIHGKMGICNHWNRILLLHKCCDLLFHSSS